MKQTDFFIEQKKQLNSEIRELKTELSHYPEGSIVCYKATKKGSTYIQRYKIQYENGRQKRSFLSKKQLDEAKILAQKAYKYRLLCDKKNELEAINAYLNCRNPETHSQMLSWDSPYKDLLLDNNDWENEEYEKSQNHPEHLIIPAPKGEYVRSKSEAIIAHVLFEHHIPYRYECMKDINGTTMAPDFTILHPRTSSEFIWEHFGLLDNDDYVSSVAYKIPRYIRSGYIPGHNFIMTFEDTKHPLSYIEVEEIVRKYFL